MLNHANSAANQSNEYRRRYERKYYKAEIVFVSNGKIFQGSLKDISLGGAFIQSKHADQLLVGEVIKLSIPFTDAQKHIKRSGRVLWKNSTGFAVDFWSH